MTIISPKCKKAFHLVELALSHDLLWRFFYIKKKKNKLIFFEPGAYTKDLKLVYVDLLETPLKPSDLACM